MTSSFRSILLIAYTTGISPTTLKTLWTQSSSSLRGEYPVRWQTARTPLAPWKNASLREARKPFSSVLRGAVLWASTPRGRRRMLPVDVTAPGRPRWIAKSVAGEVDAIKVGWALSLSGGRDVLKDIARLGYLLAALRTAEIPNVTRLIVEQVVAMGASGIITQGFVGDDSVRAAGGAAGNAAAFGMRQTRH